MTHRMPDLYGYILKPHIHLLQLSEDIRIEIFGFSDLLDFRVDPLSHGDSVSSCETLLEILETPEKMRLICTGILVKTCRQFWQSCNNHFKCDLLRAWFASSGA